MALKTISDRIPAHLTGLRWPKHYYILTMIRTRAIIERLSYDDLVKQGIIPDLMPFINQSPTVTVTKRYPPFVYQSKNFSFFGIVLDYIIRAGFRINLQQKVELGTDPVIEIIPALSDTAMLSALENLGKYETSTNMNDIAGCAFELSTILCGQTSYTIEMIAGYVPTLVNIMKELVAKWTYFVSYLNGTIRYNVEYPHGSFAGHPDIVVDSGTHQCVLDIKTTGSFSKIAKESCLQVFAYYALMKPKVQSVKYVGFVLPMQREVTIYNVEAWDSTRFLQLLSLESDKLATIPTAINDGFIDLVALTNQLTGMTLTNATSADTEGIKQLLFGMLMETANQPQYNIGGHIAKGKNIATTLRNFATENPELPCQMFFGKPKDWAA